MPNGTDTLESSSAVFYKVKHRIATDAAISVLGINQSEIKTCSFKNLSINIINSFICNNQKLETAQISIDWAMNKL